MSLASLARSASAVAPYRAFWAARDRVQTNLTGCIKMICTLTRLASDHGLTSRRARSILGLIRALGGAAIGMRLHPSHAAKSAAGNFPKTPAWKFSFVNHVTTSLFFVSTQSGMTDAAALLGLPKPNWGSAADTAAGLIPRAMPSTNAFSP